MHSVSVSKPVKIDLNIGDQLTPISCGHIVVELVKFVAYQRQQIPYTYPWLKQVVNKKKLSDDQDVKESFQSERHFRVASTALENLDFILKVGNLVLRLCSTLIICSPVSFISNFSSPIHLFGIVSIARPFYLVMACDYLFPLFLESSTRNQ